MAETSIESKAEHTPITLTQKVDLALGYDYEQLRLDTSELAQRTARLIERLRKINGSDADPRSGSLTVTEERLVEIVFHLNNGNHLAHLEESPTGPRLG